MRPVHERKLSVGPISNSAQGDPPETGEAVRRLPCHPGSTIAAALDPEADPLKRANLAVKLIEVADPGDKATLEISATQDVESLSLAQLIALADSRGISLERPGETPPELPAGS
jgi:hypothetical protein